MIILLLVRIMVFALGAYLVFRTCLLALAEMLIYHT